jgi:hypothetical protein
MKNRQQANCFQKAVDSLMLSPYYLRRSWVDGLIYEVLFSDNQARHLDY